VPTRQPQTISFIMRVRFDHIERGDKPREVELAFDCLEKMEERYRTERRRRRRGDRATSGTYRQVLTEHGKAMIADPNEPLITADKYEDAINGKWFNM